MARAEHGAPATSCNSRRRSFRPPIDDEVVVDVEACALNFADDLLCRGIYQEKPPLPFSPGLEVAGVVIGRAVRVATLRPGDRVVGVGATAVRRTRPSGAGPGSTTSTACPR